MKSSVRRLALAAIISALAPGAAAQAEEPPCKNHYILWPTCLPDGPAVKWEILPDSPIANARAHTATLLADGRVLVAGGGKHVLDPITRMWSITNPIGARTYDPLAGTWQATGPMNRWRMQHQAIRLLDGRVLVVGGDEYGKPLDYQGTAEIFDPASATWKQTGSLIVPRGGFTASLLPDGRVLVAGGVDRGDDTLGSAEIYDPETGLWQFTGNLVEPRLVHTATTLPDGRVLVVGGMIDDFSMTTTGTAEVFDPATGAWSAAGFIDARWFHTATLTEDGTVVIAGGYISAPPSGGGYYQASDVSSTAIYDPARATWSSAGNLNSPRHFHLAIRLRGSGVLLFGGRTPRTPIPRYTEAAVERAEILSRAGDRWRDVVPADTLPVSTINYYSATELADGTVLFLGDLDGARAVLLRFEPREAR